MLVDLTCVLCNQSNENTHHLFFECNYTAYIWKWFRIKIGFTTVNDLNIMDVIDYIGNMFKTDNKFHDLVKISFATCIWCIWKQRNDRVFNNHNVDKRKVCDVIVNLVSIRLSKSKKILPHDYKQKKNIEDWILPS